MPLDSADVTAPHSANDSGDSNALPPTSMDEVQEFPALPRDKIAAERLNFYERNFVYQSGFEGKLPEHLNPNQQRALDALLRANPTPADIVWERVGDDHPSIGIRNLRRNLWHRAVKLNFMDPSYSIYQHYE